MKIYNKYSKKNNLMMKFLTLSTRFLFFGLPSFIACAADRSAPIASNATADLNFNSGLNVGSLIQVFFALLFIVLLIFVLSVVLKKFNMLPGSSSNLIKIISGTSLSNKERLLLIEVGEEQILISVSSGNINKIHTLSTPIELESDVSSTSTSEKNSFSGLLNSVIKRQGS